MSKKPRISYRDLGRLTPETETAKPVPAPEAAEAPAAVATPPEAIAPVAAARKPRATVARPRPAEPDAVPPAVVPSSIVPSPVVPSSVVPSSIVPSPVVSPSAVSPSAAVQPAVVPQRFRDLARERVGSAELLLFRVGPELFGLPLSAVEEAIDCPPPHALPEMPRAMRGVFPLRDSLVALFGSDVLLGVTADSADTALVFRGRGRRLAIAVDDVDDVFTADLTLLRDAPGADAGDGILLGVVRRGSDLIGVLDPEALLAACRSDTVLEAAA